MSELDPNIYRNCARLRNRITLDILIDQQVIAALGRAILVLREENDPVVLDLEHAMRTHRISILKQRAILGAAGIDV